MWPLRLKSNKSTCWPWIVSHQYKTSKQQIIWLILSFYGIITQINVKSRQNNREVRFCHKQFSWIGNKEFKCTQSLLVLNTFWYIWSFLSFIILEGFRALKDCKMPFRLTTCFSFEALKLQSHLATKLYMIVFVHPLVFNGKEPCTGQ